ncbi:hypothetical protein [Pseudomonas helleri]|uniref:hypothetical protein n=1 Tax=Pseudomonas helleri TaxID=1608996 RepID=UPI0028E8390E|nr:hypothetical protein [Pseudomonas helleri]
MQNRKATNWVAWGLLLICLIQTAYIFLSTHRVPAPSKIISATSVGEGGAVYEVLYDSGGATVPFIYRYFLMAKQPTLEEALQETRKTSPFLVTKSSNAVHEVRGDHVFLKTSGTIYNFNNISYFKSNEEIKVVTFDLNASAP